jgi:tetratricopeptide (TPR) repeat protein
MHLLRDSVLILVVLVLTAAALQRNTTWHTLLVMGTDCAAKPPKKSRTHNNLGNWYCLLGMYFPAIAEYQKAVALDPGNRETRYNCAVQLDNGGLALLAMKPFSLFCTFAPPDFPRQQKRPCDRYQELFDEAKGSQRRSVSR